jgi:hypothetical protein
MKEPYKKVIEFYKNSSPKQHQYFLNLISDKITFFNQETKEQYELDQEFFIDFNGIFHQLNLKMLEANGNKKELSLLSLIDKQRQSTPTLEPHELLASIISKYCRWDGAFIYKLARECFTECNHHTFNKAFDKLWEKEILRTDHINKKDKNENDNK